MTKYKVAAIAAIAVFLLAACAVADAPDVTEAPATVQQGAETPSPSPEPTPAPVPTFSVNTNRQDALFNQGHIMAVYLRMNRAEIERIYKPSEQNESGYISYDGGGFFVKYYGNDTVKELVIYEKSSWETCYGISVGSTLDQLTAAYGQPLSDADGVYMYYSLENELLREPPSLTEVDINYLYSLSFTVENDAVSGIVLSRF